MLDPKVIEKIMKYDIFGDDEHNEKSMNEQIYNKGIYLSYDEIAVLKYIKEHPDKKEKLIKILKENIYDYQL